MFAGSDVHARAYEDFVRALELAPGDRPALDGLVRAATLLDREAEALAWLQAATARNGETPADAVARSRLHAAAGAAGAALAAARDAVALAPADADAIEQLASVAADAGDLAGLDAAVAALRALRRGRPPSPTPRWPGCCATMSRRRWPMPSRPSQSTRRMPPSTTWPARR